MEKKHGARSMICSSVFVVLYYASITTLTAQCEKLRSLHISWDNHTFVPFRRAKGPCAVLRGIPHLQPMDYHGCTLHNSSKWTNQPAKVCQSVSIGHPVEHHISLICGSPESRKKCPSYHKDIHFITRERERDSALKFASIFTPQSMFSKAGPLYS